MPRAGDRKKNVLCFNVYFQGGDSVAGVQRATSSMPFLTTPETGDFFIIIIVIFQFSKQWQQVVSNNTEKIGSKQNVNKSLKPDPLTHPFQVINWDRKHTGKHTHAPTYIKETDEEKKG